MPLSNIWKPSRSLHWCLPSASNKHFSLRITTDVPRNMSSPPSSLLYPVVCRIWFASLERDISKPFNFHYQLEQGLLDSLYPEGPYPRHCFLMRISTTPHALLSLPSWSHCSSFPPQTPTKIPCQAYQDHLPQVRAITAFLQHESKILGSFH